MNPEIFSATLLAWFGENKRQLPWKETKDPYKIWISEIILQQTRVIQGTPYYLNFIQRFPDIKTLAHASEDEVLKLWEGLGYYSRARNIHETAKYLYTSHEGNFPDSYEEILKLKGIGPYTAAAISSFAYGLRHAVVDGNVIRLISRIHGITHPVDSIEVRKNIQDFVYLSIQSTDPASFNQAIMDFGATVCTPKLPQCDVCPFRVYCLAYHHDQVKEIPFKSKKPIKKVRYFHYFDIRLHGELTIVVQRSVDDIWKKLFEYPKIETDSDSMPDDEKIHDCIQNIFPFSVANKYAINKSMVSKQELTHRKIVASFYTVSLNLSAIKINKGHYLVERKKVSNFAFPKIIIDYQKKVDF
jgi:A/G-specific adenine glycosylase